MPSIATQYTPLESLLFLQAIARNGTDFSALSSISQSLSTNQFVQSDEKYDANRLAPEALKELYDDLIKSEKDVTLLAVKGQVNGGDSNPRKRKLSASPERLGKSEDGALQALHMVDRLYGRYRERIIQEIKREEEEYQVLVTDIKALEEEAEGRQKPDEILAKNGLQTASQSVISASNRSASPGTDGLVPPGTSSIDGIPSKDARSKEESAPAAQSKPQQPSSGQMLPPQTTGSENTFPRPPSTVTATQRPSTAGQRVSPASPKGIPQQGQQQTQTFPPKYGPIQPPQPLSSTTSPRSSNALPPLSSIVPQPPTQRGSPAHRRSSGSLPPKTSPLLPSPSPQYPQPPPYGYPYPAWPQYNSPTSPYANPQFYHQQPYPPSQPPAQTPVSHHYQPYPQPPPPNQYGPGPYPRPPIPSQTPQYPQLPWPGQPASTASTPSAQRSGDRPRVRTWGTSTPWTPGGIRRGSPERPVRERDVSPLSDRAASPEEAGDNTKGVEGQTAPKDSPPKEASKRGRGRNMRGKRAVSTHSSVLASRSRSQSLASVTSESRPDRVAGGRTTMAKIKHETPTPAPFASDNEQRPTGRRRGRSDVLQLTSIEAGRNISNKRKRESGTEPSPSPSLPTPRPFGSRMRLRPEPIDPSLVSITKNFARIAAPILNDVNGHKLAGIFAKPLTEREAPGYKDLIYRPQDLKSIRAAVGRGSRAANVLIDEMGAEAKADDSSATGSPAAVVAKPSTPSGSVLIPKTEDLTPPKAIVNSAQLEMELVRMFANAVMFNPLPRSERGLPPELRMQKDRLNAKTTSSSSGQNKKNSKKNKTEDEDHDGDDHGGSGAVGADTGEKKGYVYAPEEEGDIIHDTREMFESVDKTVAQFRRVEQGYHHFGAGGGFGTDDVVARSSVGAAGTVGIGLRGGSVSVSDAVAEESAQEDAGGGETVAVSGTGTARKRRRLLE